MRLGYRQRQIQDFLLTLRVWGAESIIYYMHERKGGEMRRRK